MRTYNKTKIGGFTLMELLIAIAIVAILAAIAIPSYLTYVRKSQFSEIVQTADTLKVSVAQCAQRLGDPATCVGGSNGIPANIAAGTGVGQVDSVTVTAGGVITVTPRATNGFVAGDTYILTPNYTANGITWTASGGGCTNGYASGC